MIIAWLIANAHVSISASTFLWREPIETDYGRQSFSYEPHVGNPYTNSTLPIGHLLSHTLVL